MASIEPDHEALAAFIRSKDFQDGVTEPLMRKVEDRAVEISPVLTGNYKAKWRHEVDADGGHLYNDADYAWYVEKGNSKGAPAQHIAMRALDALRE